MKSVPVLNKSERGLFRKIFIFPGLLLLFMMIIVPQAYQEIKLVLLLIVLIEIFIYNMITRRLHLHSKIFRLHFVYIFIGIMYGLYGFSRENMGALPITKEVVLYPTFFMIFISAIRSHLFIRYIHKTLVLSAIATCIYIIVSYLNANGVWPDWLYINLKTETFTQDITTGHLSTFGRIEMAFSSYASLMFLQPYLFCYLLIRHEKKSKLLWFSVFITTIVMLNSSSRILLIIAILFPILIIISLNVSKYQSIYMHLSIKKVVLSFTIMSIITFIILDHYGFNLQVVLDDLSLGFKKYEFRPSGKWLYNHRINTFFVLFDAFLERPLFGYGSGAVNWAFTRNAIHPYVYELSYMQYLFYWGLVGCMLYAAGLYYIYKTSVRIFRENSIYSSYALSAAVGSVGFLFGSGTNPYLLRFDSFYAIFLPIAIVNIWLINKN